MPEEKVFTLKPTADGLEVTSQNPRLMKPVPKGPEESDIDEPRWSHWYQRKMGRVWHVTLLGMNIEPTAQSRSALKAQHPKRFKIFEDRMDIARTLLGYDLPYFQDHLREGDKAGDKYIALADYYQFAFNLGWAGLDSMREGLQIDSKPSMPQEIRQKQKNNLLVLLNEAFLVQVPGYDVKKPGETATAILKWMSGNGLRSPVQQRTLKEYITEVAAAIEQFDEREKQSHARMDVDRVQSGLVTGS